MRRHQYQLAIEYNQDFAGLIMMDSLVNSLRLSHMTIVTVVEVQT